MGICQCSLHLNVARSFVNYRIKSSYPAREVESRQIITVDVKHAAYLYLGRSLLRNPEIYIDRIDRLQRHNRLSCGKVLAQVDLANTQNAGEGRSDCFSLDCRLHFTDFSFG